MFNREQFELDLGDFYRAHAPSYKKKVIASKHDREAECFLRSKAKGLGVVFHGTRYAETIIRENTLKYARIGDPVVSFTRLAEVAVTGRSRRCRANRYALSCSSHSKAQRRC